MTLVLIVVFVWGGFGVVDFNVYPCINYLSRYDYLLVSSIILLLTTELTNQHTATACMLQGVLAGKSS